MPYLNSGNMVRNVIKVVKPNCVMVEKHKACHKEKYKTNITFLSLYQSIPYEAYKGILFVHKDPFFWHTKILICSYKFSSIFF
jgi:hypothetical protein